MTDYKNIDHKDRKKESDLIFKKYPKSIPIIIKTNNNETPKLNKHKYIVPNNLLFAHFFNIIRNQLNLPKEKALFFFTNKNTLLSSAMQLSVIFEKYKSEDGFLYLFYSLENVFG